MTAGDYPPSTVECWACGTAVDGQTGFDAAIRRMKERHGARLELAQRLLYKVQATSVFDEDEMKALERVLSGTLFSDLVTVRDMLDDLEAIVANPESETQV